MNSILSIQRTHDLLFCIYDFLQRKGLSFRRKKSHCQWPSCKTAWLCIFQVTETLSLSLSLSLSPHVSVLHSAYMPPLSTILLTSWPWHAHRLHALLPSYETADTRWRTTRVNFKLGHARLVLLHSTWISGRSR